jgi:uncharacterized membrane protein
VTAANPVAPRAVALSAPVAESRSRDRAWSIAAVGAGIGFFVLVTWMALTRHANFETGRLDLEIYTQVVWSIADGRGFSTTLLKTNLNHLAEHLAFILVPIAGLYRLWPDPRLLLLIHGAALAALGIPVFLLARRRLGSGGQALIVLVCFYLTPAMAGVALDDFHAVPIAAVPRVWWGTAITLLAMLMEEETALGVMGLGAFLFVRGQRIAGLVAGAAGFAWLALSVFVVMPSFHDPRTLGGVGGNRTVGHFAELMSHGSVLLDRLLGERGRDALVWLVLSTAGLAVLSPSTLLMSAPTFMALLLQNRDDTFGRHWVAPLVIVLWLGTIAGLATLRAPIARRAGLAAIVAGTLLSFLVISPLPGGGLFDADALVSTERAELLRRAVSRVPPSAIVVASPNVVAHLANRPEVYVFPIDSHYAEELGWRRKRPDVYVLDQYDELTTRATNSERLNPLNADRPFHVWSAGRKIFALFNNVAEPTHPLDARYGDRLWLRGYDLLHEGGRRRIVLHWERYAELRGRYDRDLTITDMSGNRLFYQEDMALSSIYGSNKWRPGQRILDEVDLPTPNGELRLRIAWVAQEKRAPFRLADGSEAFDLVVR